MISRFVVADRRSRGTSESESAIESSSDPNLVVQVDQGGGGPRASR